MELTISFDDAKKDGILHGKVTLDFDAKMEPILESLQALSKANIPAIIANALTKKEESGIKQ